MKETRKILLCPYATLREIFLSLLNTTGEMNENALSAIIVDYAFKVHTTLGLGLLESVYEAVI